MRWRAIALEQHDEGRRAGQEACRDAHAEKTAPVVVVMVVVMVVVPVHGRARVVTVRAAVHAREQHRGADADYEETRGQREPGIQRLRHDELRQRGA